MSRLDTETPEMMTTAAHHGLEVITPRDVPLGGPRAMSVRRTLPNRTRTTIGAWCFLDHYGPDRVEVTGGMVVPPHPHIGLQTVSWLFEGDIEHRDSTGAHALVAPGEVNLMTAGWGIQHSEVSTPTTHTLHGVQLWVALPEGARNMPPQFDRATAVTHLLEGGSVHLFVGSLPGLSGVNLPTFTPLGGLNSPLSRTPPSQSRSTPGSNTGSWSTTGRPRSTGLWWVTTIWSTVPPVNQRFRLQRETLSPG